MLTKIRTLFILVAAVSALFSFTAFSQTNYDMGALEFGKWYNAPSGKISVGTFIAPKTGKITVSFKPGVYDCDIATSSDFNDESYILGSFNQNFSQPAFTYQVEEGTTYYMRVNLIIQSKDAVFSLFMDGVSTLPFNVSVVSPGANGNSRYDLSMNERMYIRFSRQLAETYDVNMVYASNGGSQLTKQLSPSYTSIANDMLYVNMADIMDELLNDSGATGISPNATFTVNIKVQDEAGQSPNGSKDGWLSYTYRCGYLPTKIVSAIWPEQFLSFWPKDDENGIGKVTYSAPLRTSPAPTVTLLMGNVEGDTGVDLYRAYLPARIEGNTVYVDLTGVRRSLSDIMTSPAGTDYMSITINGLYDTNGLAVVTNVAGGIANYNVNLPYKDLGKTMVVSDWTPANGSNLDNYNKIEVWISGLSTVRFDGFTVECITDDSQIAYINIPLQDITISEQSADGEEAVYTFDIPSMAKTADKVSVYPFNLVSINGFDYLANLTATYNCLTIMSINPKQGADVNNLANEDVIINLNYGNLYPDMVAFFSIEDENPVSEDRKIVMDLTPLSKTGAASFSLEQTKKLNLYQGHTYQAVVTAWASENDYLSGKEPIGVASATWFGAATPYVASTAKLISINPEDGTEVAADGIFNASFDTMVHIGAASSGIKLSDSTIIPFVEIIPTADYVWTDPDTGYSYSTDWELRADLSKLNNGISALSIIFAATDEDGKVVAGNKDYDEDSYFEFAYSNTLGTDKVTLSGFENVTIFTLSGIKILKDAPVESLKNLPAGLYIVNGKKLMINQ